MLKLAARWVMLIVKKLSVKKRLTALPPPVTLSSSLFSRAVHLDSDGFSLLEMVVVLAIIGILVSIQLPNVIGNTDRAKFIAAQTRISNAISECATAKTNGSTERQLRFSNPGFIDLVPSMSGNPDGYVWESNQWRGCFHMTLAPVDSDGNRAYRQGYPVLLAKLAPGGRIVKAADLCQPLGTIDFTKDCNRWDPTNTSETGYRTGRDLSDPNWARRASTDEE